MMSLFNSFDYYYNFFPCLGYLILGYYLAFSFWSTSMLMSLVNNTYSYLTSFFYSLSSSKIKMLDINLISIMIFIFLVNLFSIFPYNFPMTSQVSFNFYLSFTIWSSFFLYSLIYNFKGQISHFIPSGSPLGLSIFLFLIEVVSNVIRPLTLMIRLLSNILAGHLLMILLASLVQFYFSAFIFYFFLNIIEIFVAMIQSYIFVTMIYLYYSDLY